MPATDAWSNSSTNVASFRLPTHWQRDNSGIPVAHMDGQNGVSPDWAISGYSRVGTISASLLAKYGDYILE